MMDIYSFIASHLYIYAEESEELSEKYKYLLNSKNNSLLAKIKNDYYKSGFKKSPEVFAKYSGRFFTAEQKKKKGIEYTPKEIADAMSSYVIGKLELDLLGEIKIIDPAIGSGIMALSILRLVHQLTGKDVLRLVEENFYGVDNNNEQLLLSEITLSLLSLELSGSLPSKFNLLNHDSFKLTPAVLKKSFGESFFDIIITNPPYIRSKNLDANTVSFIKEQYSATSVGIVDTYIPFFEISINLLKEGGLGILITPNSYLTTNNGKALRKYLLNHTSEIKLVNFMNEKVFDKVSSYSVITFFKKESDCRNKNNLEAIILEKSGDNKTYHTIQTQKLIQKDTWRTITKFENNIINKLEKSFKYRLQDLNFKNGIATQRNKIYSFDYQKADTKYYHFMYKDKLEKVEKGITRKFITPNQKEQNDNRRIIFPYEYDSLIRRNKIISEIKMKNNYPYAYKYLQDNREELDKRSVDKNIPAWYAYGRSQGINDSGLRLYLPYMASKVHTSISIADDEIFAAGYAIFNENESYLNFIGDILSSNLFSYYIASVSKPYSHGYFSTAKSQIKNFSIPSEKEFEERIKKDWNEKNVYGLYGIDKGEIEFIEQVAERKQFKL